MFAEPFMLIALGVGIVTGSLCAYLGNFLLMRNMTFVSIALSETAALGVALGFALRFDPTMAAFLATIAAVVFFWQRNRRWHSTDEGLIGVLYAASAALAVVVVARNPMMESHGIDLVSGNLLYCTAGDLLAVSAMCAAVAIPHALFRKEFLFVSFDRETAKAQGLRADLWDLVLMLSIGFCIAVCMQLTGVLFVFASLIVPGMASLILFRRVSAVFAASVALVILSVPLGLVVSYRGDLPTSPTIICVYALFFAATSLWRTLRTRLRR